MAAHCAQPNAPEPSCNISLDRGKSFPILRSERIIIGPRESSKPRFANSKVTKEAVLKCIDPVKLKMKINSVNFGPQSSVILEGPALDPKTLASCTALGAEGLEIKPDIKQNPRLVVHDIPVQLTADEIVSCIVEQNLPEASGADVKHVFLYPAATQHHKKRFRSCIIETLPEHRPRLLKLKKVTIKWSACRIDDHVSIVQCFNCHRFGNLANNCADRERCGKCVLFDKAKCPILREKIDRKISSINYGD